VFVVVVAVSSHGNRAMGVTAATAVPQELGRGTRGRGRSQRSRLAIGL